MQTHLEKLQEAVAAVRRRQEETELREAEAIQFNKTRERRDYVNRVREDLVRDTDERYGELQSSLLVSEVSWWIGCLIGCLIG